MRTPIKHGNPASFFGEGCACNLCTTAAVIASPKVAENMMARQIGRDNAKRKVERIMTTHANDSVFASDHDREVVCNQLATATGEGRITADEHEDLVGRALASRKRGELRRLIDELPNPKLPELPAPIRAKVKAPKKNKKPVDCSDIGLYIFIACCVLFIMGLIGVSVYEFWPVHYNPMPIPTTSITDPQDRSFVQMMITYHNSANMNADLTDDRNPRRDIDEAAVLAIAHLVRDPHNDVRQEFLLVMGSTGYKNLTMGEKYYAGKTALSVWRAGDEAAWVAMGKDQGYE